MRYLLTKLRNYPEDGASLHAGYYVSEKLDGIRALWDGGVTRGMVKADVPWANTQKDGRYVNEQIATGLWSQLGHVIHAPDWFLDKLPNAVIEGELFAGRGNWQLLSSTVKKQTPIDAEWRRIRFVAFDTPPVATMFRNGRIRYGASYNHVLKGALSLFVDGPKSADPTLNYRARRYLRDRWYEDTIVEEETLVHHQRYVEEKMSYVVCCGGEGVVLKAVTNIWTPERARDAYKLKPEHDSEAMVVGWTPGKGKFLGMMGALQCMTLGDDNGVKEGIRFELSGFTDGERMLTRDGSEPVWFKHGDTITFKYREVSDNGTPKEARFLRKREND